MNKGLQFLLGDESLKKRWFRVAVISPFMMVGIALELVGQVTHNDICERLGWVFFFTAFPLGLTILSITMIIGLRKKAREKEQSAAV